MNLPHSGQNNVFLFNTILSVAIQCLEPLNGFPMAWEEVQHFNSLCIIVCGWWMTYMGDMACMRRLEDSWKTVLTFHSYVSSWGWAQVSGLHYMCLTSWASCWFIVNELLGDVFAYCVFKCWFLGSEIWLQPDFGMVITLKHLLAQYFVKHYSPLPSDWSNKELDSQ